jgi:hypothetical protein
MKRIVWTMNYRPFIMGGNVHSPITTEIDLIEEREIKGIPFFTWKTPKGSVKLSEGITGAIVADGFDGLLGAISGCSKQFLKDQLQEGIAMFEHPIALSNDEFFKAYTY